MHSFAEAWEGPVPSGLSGAHLFCHTAMPGVQGYRAVYFTPEQGELEMVPWASPGQLPEV